MKAVTKNSKAAVASASAIAIGNRTGWFIGKDATGKAVKEKVKLFDSHSIQSETLVIGDDGTAYVQAARDEIEAAGIVYGASNIRNGLRVKRNLEQQKTDAMGGLTGIAYFDCALYVSNGKGENAGEFWIGSTAEAIKQGLVKKAVVTLKNGKQANVLLHAKFNDKAAVNGDKQHVLRYVACADVTCAHRGRMELRMISDRRNQAYVQSASNIALVDTGAKTGKAKK